MAENPSAGVIYCRISDDTEGLALGVSRQEQDCRALAERLGWQLHPTIPVLVDNDVSASTKSKRPRPAFNRLLDGVQVGEFDGVLYYSNSRLTRRPREYETIIDLVATTGVRLATVASGMADLATADGRMLGRMLAAQDAAEAERIGERVRRAFAQRRDAGLPNLSRRAFGFEPGGVIVKQAEAEVIRFAANLILEGASINEVKRQFDAKGIKPLHAPAWNRMTIRRLVTNPRMAGLVAQDGKILGEGVFEAILDRETFDKVGVLLSQRGSMQRGAYTGAPVHLLAGFIACGKCGKPMRVNAMRHPDGSLRSDSFIVCSITQHGCGGMKRNLRLVEAYVTEQIETHLAKAPTLQVNGDEPQEPDLGAMAVLVAKIEKLEGRLTALQADYATGEIDSMDFVPTVRMLRTNLLNAKAELAEFEMTLDGSEPVTAEDTLRLWQGGDVHDRRDILADLRVSIILHTIGKVGAKRAAAAIPQTTEINLYQ